MSPSRMAALCFCVAGCGRINYEVFDGSTFDAAGIDAQAIDATGIDAASPDEAGTDAAGTDAAGTDAAGTDAAGTDAGCTVEICGNGLDDDCNGRADEGCSCDPGVHLFDAPAITGYDALWTGSELVVVAAIDIGIIQLSRFTLAGTPIAPPVMLDTFPEDVGAPRLATDGSTILVVWHSLDGGNQTIRAAIYPDTFAAGTPLILRDGADPALTPAIAWLGGTYGIAWVEGPGLSPPVYAGQLDSTATALTGMIALTTNEGRAPSITRGIGDGNGWIAWRDQPGAYSEILLIQWSGGGPSGTPVSVVSGAPSGFVHEPFLAVSGGSLGIAGGDASANAFFQIDPPSAPIPLPSAFSTRMPAADLVATSSGWVMRAGPNAIRIDRVSRTTSAPIVLGGLDTRLVPISGDIVVGVRTRLSGSMIEFSLIDCL